jgi:hypothetical protein
MKSGGGAELPPDFFRPHVAHRGQIMKIQQSVGPIAALVLMALASTADAQSWPAKPIRIISPYPPAGANDLLARIIAPKLSEQLGQPVVVENRAGATGNIGAELVAKAPADGYTLLMGQAGNLTINISLMAKIPFDPVRDFSPVTMVASSVFLRSMHPLTLTRFSGTSFVGTFSVSTSCHFIYILILYFIFPKISYYFFPKNCWLCVIWVVDYHPYQGVGVLQVLNI